MDKDFPGELIVKIECYSSGEIEFKSNHEPWSGKGLLVDSYTHYYKNVSRISEGNYMPGTGCLPGDDVYSILECEPLTEHGSWTYWCSNGQKKIQCNYHYGVKNRLCITWYKNGDKELEVLYKDGLIVKEESRI